VDLSQIFGTENPVIGVVHLLPLPTSPRWQGNLQLVVDRAEQEATALASGGVNGIIVENFLMLRSLRIGLILRWLAP
jgi:predicted TIM-barrel enzyme